MKILELFAGSRSIGKVCDQYGLTCFSVDIEPFEGIDLVKDIEYLTLRDLPFVPDMVWASPDCTTYSIAAISHHRRGTVAVSEYAQKSDRVNLNALSVIQQLLKLNPDMKFFIENPVGMMRKMPFMRGIPKATVSYCRYGDTRMKPTDIWTNHLYSLFNPTGWQPKRKCFNGNTACHHEPSTRGSKTGTQGLKDWKERSRIPEQLVREIISAALLNSEQSAQVSDTTKAA